MTRNRAAKGRGGLVRTSVDSSGNLGGSALERIEPLGRLEIQPVPRGRVPKKCRQVPSVLQICCPTTRVVTFVN